MIGPSLFKSADWRTALIVAAQTHETGQALLETDPSSLSEGVYLKVEQNDVVTGRYKFIRPDFLQAILESGPHWATRPILPNQLAPGVDIMG